jgi:hypothetical protein
VCWSLDIARAGSAALVAAAIGFVAAPVELYLLLLGPITADTVGAVLGVQLLWCAFIGVLLVRRDL